MKRKPGRPTPRAFSHPDDFRPEGYIKPLMCPHGSALPCSQCMGAVARQVVCDARTGQITVDGEFVRQSVLHAGIKKNQEHSEAMITAAKTARPPRCHNCNMPGHTARTCQK